MFGSCASAIKSTLLPPDTKFPVMIDAPDDCKLTKIFLSRQI